MAGRRTILFGVVLIAVHVGSVMSSTLYQWVVDSQTRFNYDPDRSNSLGKSNRRLKGPLKTPQGSRGGGILIFMI